jgi:murein DD-endopeptidase MepM/ murein hydrolase activator NlpD
MAIYLSAQEKYPKNYFRSPLDIPLVLAGTFGELRSNHFHSGIDIKTQKKEGLPVYASAYGSVSRIKIKHWGYGKALYVTHPNGYTTVYAHLKKFAPKIEEYVKKQQYKKESYTIQLFPNSDLLKVKKGEIIAYSGNTGGSSAPHLHFEIRDTKTEKTINPLLFGISVDDDIKPEINSAYVYSLDEQSQVNQSQLPVKLEITKVKPGLLKTNLIEAFGSIGVGIKAFDRLNGAKNKNGLYNVDVYLNNQKIYNHCLETFSFSESKYINLLIDYPRYASKRERVQRCFVVPNNRLSIYKDLVNSGEIYIQDGMQYTIKVIVSDAKGNETTLLIPVKGKNQEIKVKNQIKKTDYFFKRNEFNKITKDNVTVAFPKYSFYNDIYFDFKYENGVVDIHDKSVPLHKSFTLSFDVSEYPFEEQEKLFIAKISKRGKLSYVNTKRKPNKLYTLSKSFGKYILATDTEKPIIKPMNFKNGQWLTNKKLLKVYIKDDLTGIKSYRATIDGEWILMEYEPKTGLLFYDFNDKKFTNAKHTLKIIVKDQVKNTNTYIATFYRKK